MQNLNISASSAWNRTRLAARLGIEFPIIQGPFGGMASQRLTAEVSNFGGLGSFGAHSLTPDALRDVIAEIRSLTARPFAINLWVSMEDEGASSSDEAAFARSLSPLAPYFEQLGEPLPVYKPYVPASFEAQARVLLDANVPVFSFIYGIPSAEILAECRARGIATIGTATTPDEAGALERAGVDVIVASGFEAGGHRGSFLRPAEDSLTGTFSLVPQVVDAVDAPVAATGGIADARGIVAALALGAEGVQIGTAFLACAGSGASELHREALLGGKAGRTTLTKGFTGRLARGIHNHLAEELNRPDVETLPYPLQRALVRNLTIPAEKAGRQDLISLWAGQSANLAHSTSATALLEQLVHDVSSIGEIVADWSGRRKSTG